MDQDEASCPACGLSRSDDWDAQHSIVAGKLHCAGVPAANEGRVVARLRLPMPAGSLKAISDALERAYGDGLVAMESPAGWLLVGRPQ